MSQLGVGIPANNVRSRIKDAPLLVAGAIICVALGTAIAMVPPFPDDPLKPLLLVGFLLNLLALGTAIRRASGTGLLIGIPFLGIHVLGWTLSESGVILGALNVLYGGALIALALLRKPRVDEAPWRDFTWWTGVAVAVPWVLNALAAVDPTIAVSRFVLAAGVAGAFAISRRADSRGLVWGLIAGTHLVLAPVLACGLVTDLGAFRPVAVLADVAGRFGGGGCAYVHPNLIGLAAWTLVIAWLGLGRDHFIGRLCGIATCTLLILITDSRTAAGAALLAVAAYVGAKSLRRGTRGIRMAGLAIIAIFTLLGSVTIAQQFFLRERGTGIGVLTGRDYFWAQTISDFKASSSVEKLIGTTKGGTGADLVLTEEAGVEAGTKISTHNAFLAVLRRGGLVGIVIAITGFLMMLVTTWRMLVSGRAPWAAALLVGAIATSPVEAWLFGGAIWIWTLVAYRYDRDLMTKTEENDSATSPAFRI